MTERTVKVQSNIKLKNDSIANELRTFFNQNNIKCFNIMGSIGSGKTSLISLACQKLKAQGYRIFVINGDLATSIDADRIAATAGVKTFQINTGKGCHLNARQIQQVIHEQSAKEFDIIFIENVGNLICPSGWDLGEHLRIAIVSVSEGVWVVKKHPIMFKKSDVAIINKIDIADTLEVNTHNMVKDAKTINPSMTVVLTSAKKEIGIDQLIQALNLKDKKLEE